MQLNKYTGLVLGDFLLQRTNDSFFIVNKNFKVQLANEAFARLIKKSARQIENLDFGKALGCSNILKDERECAFTSYCSGCEIRKNIRQILQKKETKIQFDLVREYLINDEIVIKHFQFNMELMRMGSIDYVLCIIKDLGEEDEGIFKNKPEKSI